MGWTSFGGKNPVFLDKKEVEIDKHIGAEVLKIKEMIDHLLSYYKFLTGELHDQLETHLKKLSREEARKYIYPGNPNFYMLEVKEIKFIEKVLKNMKKCCEGIIKYINEIESMERKIFYLNRKHHLIEKKIGFR